MAFTQKCPVFCEYFYTATSWTEKIIQVMDCSAGYAVWKISIACWFMAIWRRPSLAGHFEGGHCTIVKTCRCTTCSTRSDYTQDGKKRAWRNGTRHRSADWLGVACNFETMQCFLVDNCHPLSAYLGTNSSYEDCIMFVVLDCIRKGRLSTSLKTCTFYMSTESTVSCSFLSFAWDDKGGHFHSRANIEHSHDLLRSYFESF